jgi:hypothetical protein
MAASSFRVAVRRLQRRNFVGITLPALNTFAITRIALSSWCPGAGRLQGLIRRTIQLPWSARAAKSTPGAFDELQQVR